MYNPSLQTVDPVEPNWFKQLYTRAQRQVTFANIIGLTAALLALLCLLGLRDTQYWNIRIPLYIIVITWTILRPRVALYLLPFAIPWGTLDPISLGGASFNSADILVGLITTGWLLGFTLRPLVAKRGNEGIGTLDRETFNTPRSVVYTILFLLFTLIVSLFAAGDLSAGLKEIIKWVEVLVIVLLGNQYIRTRRQIWLFIVILCIATISQACLAYAQTFFHIGPEAFIREDSLRVYGTFDQPNPFAGYINITLTIMLALCLLGSNLKTRVLAGLASLILLGAEYYTQSKGGWLALAFAIVFIFFVGMPRLRILFTLGGIALLCAIEAFLAGFIPSRLYMPLLHKFGLLDISFTTPSSENYANSERVAHWVAGLQMFWDHPLIGVGIGNYEHAYPNYIQGIFKLPLGHAHNYYINMAAETGMFGLLAFIVFIGATFVLGGRSTRILGLKAQKTRALLKQPKRALDTKRLSLAQTSNLFKQVSILVNDRALAVGVLAALLSISVHNLVDNLYVHSITSLFALLIVLLIRVDKVT